MTEHSDDIHPQDNESTPKLNAETVTEEATIIESLGHNDDKQVQNPSKGHIDSESNISNNSNAISKDQTPATTVNTTNTNSISNTTPESERQIAHFEAQVHKLKRDLENMVLKYAKSERENLINQQKVTDLDKKLTRAIKDNDQLANRIKLLTNDKNHLTETLSAKVAQLTVLEQKNSYLNGVQSIKLKEYEVKLKKLEETNEDLLKQIESYKSKEGELLDFSEQLSMKYLMLQTDLNEALKKLPDADKPCNLALTPSENSRMTREELSKEVDRLTSSLDAEKELSKAYCVLLKENEERYQSRLDELENEIKVLRRKHQIAIKELMKEIRHLRSTNSNGLAQPIEGQIA